MPNKKTIEQKIDALARMTQRGFIEVDKRFAEADSKFSELRKEMATKSELRGLVQELRQEMRETEEHLLDAIRGIEVKKRDFESLVDIVERLEHRVAALEKRR